MGGYLTSTWRVSALDRYKSRAIGGVALPPDGDPTAALITALLAFSPDVLLVGDAGTSTTTGGQPVSSWADQSGNGNDASQTGSARPNYTLSLTNGRAGLTFDGVNDFMLGAFVNTTKNLTDIAVYRGAVSGDDAGRISSVGPTGQDEAGVPGGAIVLRYNGASDHVGIYRSVVGAVSPIATVRNVFHSAASVMRDATPSYFVQEGAINNGAGGAGTDFATDKYGIGASIAGNSFFTGDILFRAIWASDQTDNLAAILTLVDNYYGL